MNSFIKSVRNATNKKEILIKRNITTQLSNTIKEIQLYSIESSASVDASQMNEAITTLSYIVEALLLHGLKDSLVYRARRAIADIDQRPDPSFWAPLLIISHRQIIDQITNLPQITTEIGQCRAWIRITLNDCLLSSYISSMRQDSSVIKPFYNSYAYVRDAELLEVAQKLIEGIETVTSFSLACNSSLLNNWQLDTLVLAGIWSPTLRSCPVASAVDVAQSLSTPVTDNSETVSLNSARSFTSSSTGLGAMMYLNEDEALKIILAKHSTEQQQTSKTILNTLPENVSLSTEKNDVDEGIPEELSDASVSLMSDSNVGNSLNKRSGWSSLDTQEEYDETEIKQQSTLESTNNNVENSKSAESSYNALIESYNMLGGGYVRTPDLKQVWQYLEKKNNGDQLVLEVDDTVSSNILEIEDDSDKTKILPMLTYVGKIANERGLKEQDYNCAGCKEKLALSPKPKICGFTAEYFCDNCMSNERIYMPARVVHNWDFKTYPVSQRTLNYINEIKDQATIDLKTINPLIYTISDDMSNLQSLRIQLNFLRDYLYTCRGPIIEQLQNQMDGKDYLYEHVHQYSISDLADIRNGVLFQHLQRVVKFAKEHVQGCWLCGQKGFICEVCNKSKILYPFDIENVSRCNVCNAVYHKSCLTVGKPCPKCERRKKREDLTLVGATMD